AERGSEPANGRCAASVGVAVLQHPEPSGWRPILRAVGEPADLPAGLVQLLDSGGWTLEARGRKEHRARNSDRVMRVSRFAFVIGTDCAKSCTSCFCTY